MADMNWCMPLQYVLFPAPGLPSTSCANGMLFKDSLKAGWWDSKGANRWWRGIFWWCLMVITNDMECAVEKIKYLSGCQTIQR